MLFTWGALAWAGALRFPCILAAKTRVNSVCCMLCFVKFNYCAHEDRSHPGVPMMSFFRRWIQLWKMTKWRSSRKIVTMGCDGNCLGKRPASCCMKSATHLAWPMVQNEWISTRPFVLRASFAILWRIFCMSAPAIEVDLVVWSVGLVGS